MSLAPMQIDDEGNQRNGGGVQRQRPLSIALLLFVMGILPCVTKPAFAQAPLPLKTLSPIMPVKVCHNLDAAKAQAVKSRELALKPTANADEYESGLAKECEVLAVRVSLEEEEHSIVPFTAWTHEIMPNGEYDFTVDFRDIRQEVKVGLTLQQVRYYQAKIKDDTGKWYLVWLEMPDSPTVLRYITLLQSRERQQRQR
jgi:hypothetical protein